MVSRRVWIVALLAVAAALASAALVARYRGTADEKGMHEAAADHARGHYELKVVGLPYAWDGEHARLLKERYGVEMRHVAGCIVSPELKTYVEEYNTVSLRLLVEKYGKDIDAECARDAERQWRAEHLEQ